jgi:hypothetical protein
LMSHIRMVLSWDPEANPRPDKAHKCADLIQMAF